MGSCANGPEGRKCSSATLWCGMLVADGADDAGLVVGQMRDGDAGRPAQRRVATLRRHHEAAVDVGASGDAHRRACRRAAPPRRWPARITRNAGSACMRRVQRHAQAACLHHVAECCFTGGAMVEVQEQRRGCPPEAAVADANVHDGAGRLGQPIPDAGVLEQAARAGGNGVGTAVECRMLHRRQLRRGPPPRSQSLRRPAGRPACRRPGQRRVRTPRPSDARSWHTVARTTHCRQGVATALLRLRSFRHIVASSREQRAQRVAIHMATARTAETRRLASPTIKALIRQRSAALTGLVLGMLGLALLGGAGVLRPARPVAEHGNLAPYRQPGGTGRRGARRPAVARLWRGRGIAGTGDACLGMADRLAARAGQHGCAAGRHAGGAAGAGRGAGSHTDAPDLGLADSRRTWWRDRQVAGVDWPVGWPRRTGTGWRGDDVDDRAGARRHPDASGVGAHGQRVACRRSHCPAHHAFCRGVPTACARFLSSAALAAFPTRRRRRRPAPARGTDPPCARDG